MRRYLLVGFCMLIGAAVGHAIAHPMVLLVESYDHGSDYEEWRMLTIPVGALIGAGIAFAFLDKNVMEE